MLYVFGDYTLDPTHYELHQQGKLVRLEPRVFKLLAYLVQHPGHTVTTAELLDLLYPRESVPVERLNNAVAQARKALSDKRQTPRYIQTVHRLGYRFIAAVEIRERAAMNARSPTPPAVAPERHGLDPSNVGPPPAPFPSAPPSPPLPGPLLVSTPEATTTNAPCTAVLGAPGDEWRQLTVLACQLVGVSGHPTPFDREALLEVVRHYQAMCTEVIQQFDGHIVQYQVERLIVYFGYPLAHEDDARRAVHTGLGMVAGMGELNRHRRHASKHDRGVRLAVQVGIHTGVELVGAVGRGDQRVSLAVGETPTIAAGLQRLAEPDTVVISTATWQLIQGYFVCEALDAHRLEDRSPPLAVYRVLQESTAQHGLAVAVPQGRTPFVGREHEVALLLERWEQAREGMGQVVVLSGEAGIGKSRLAQVCRGSMAGAAHAWLEFHCSPYYQHTALYPVMTYIRRFLQFQTEETAEERLHKLEHMLVGYGVALEEVVPLFAALLSLPPPVRYPLLTLPPQLQKQKMLATLLAWLLKEAEHQPVCVLMEDLHWGDASTLEWLSLLMDQLPTARLLLLLLCRPEFRPPWALRSHLTQIALSRLSHRQVETMVEGITGSKALPAEVLQHLVATTDGVPLFVEELTKMVLESGLVKEREGRYELTGPLPPLAIPATLHDLLTARLDRLGPAKQVAQLGAIVGREFSYEVICAVSSVEEETLQKALPQLVAAELLYQQGLPPQARYRFKHALIQEAAYASLLRSTRRQYHQQIAQVLEARFPETRETQPELLAHHYTEARHSAQAVPYWQRAGQRAIERSAYVEAIAHVRRGLELLKALPATPEQTRQELMLQVALGVALIATKGHGAAEVGQVYQRALELCQRGEQSPEHFPVLVGLWNFYQVRAECAMALSLAEQSLHLAQQLRNTSLRVRAHFLMGATLFYLGEFPEAWSHLQQSMRLYNSQQYPLSTFNQTVNPVVACRAYAALTLWLLGYPTQARQQNAEALRLSQEAAHPFSTAYTLIFAGWLHQWLGEAQTAQELAEAARALATEQGFPFWGAAATILQGKAQGSQGQWDTSLDLLRQGLVDYQTAGAELLRPMFLTHLGEAYGQAGQSVEGLHRLATALALVEQHQEGLWKAELYRLQGELLLAQSAAQVVAAETSFQQALAVAQKQQAKSLELRAAISLSRLWQQQGRRVEACELLTLISGWFTEGFDTTDLEEAKALLVALR